MSRPNHEKRKTCYIYQVFPPPGKFFRFCTENLFREMNLWEIASSERHPPRDDRPCEHLKRGRPMRRSGKSLGAFPKIIAGSAYWHFNAQVRYNYSVID